MNETRTVGEARYDWCHDGMRETEEGNYVLATNKRLAADALLAACKLLVKYDGENCQIGDTSYDDVIAAARAAIASAEA